MTAALFPEEEYRARLTGVQERMQDRGIAAILLTGDADLRYFSGFLTRFWESPTRPWFLVLPADGLPIAVVPAIGAALMGATWIEDIRSWRAPDPQDDGVTLLAEALRSVSTPGACIAWPGGVGTHLRMPLEDWGRLRGILSDRRFASDGGIVAAQRMVKSEAEIARIRAACAVAQRAFDRVPGIAAPGIPLSEVFRHFQKLCLEEGADWVPYLAGGAGPGGYRDVISPADDAPLSKGDVMMLDTGLMRAGYFCDFDRNFSLGAPTPEVAAAHARLIEATAAGFETVRAGVTARAVFEAMDRVLTGGQGGSDAGRLGHGLGMQLTEPPSLTAGDETVLRAGMVLTLEPGIDMGGGRIMVHEENIVVRETGAEWLTRPAGPAIEVIAS